MKTSKARSIKDVIQKSRQKKFDINKLKIVQFARKIEKNTADFDMFDMTNFYRYLTTNKLPVLKPTVRSCMRLPDGKIRLTWR